LQAAGSPREAALLTRVSAFDVAGPGGARSATATCATGTEAAVNPARTRAAVMERHPPAAAVSSAAAALPERHARRTMSLPTPRLERPTMKGTPIICAAEKKEIVTPTWLALMPSFVIIRGRVERVTPTPSICTKTARQIGSSVRASGDDGGGGGEGAGEVAARSVGGA